MPQIPPRVALACLAAALALPVAPARASVPLEVKAVQGQQAPGAAPGLVFAGFGNPVVNDAGEVAFVGFVSDPALAIGGSGLFGPDASGSPTLIALDFEPVPGMPPDTEFRFLQTYFPRLDAAGEVAFQAGLSGPGITYPQDASGIWRWSAGGGLELVARAGDPVPEAGPGLVLGPIGGDVWMPTIGPDARVGFVSSLDDGLGASDTAFVSVDADGNRAIVASAGVPVPGVPGAELTYVFAPRVNRPGQWSLLGMFDGPGVVPGVDDSASFLWDPQAGLAMLARAGDPAPGMPAGVVFADGGTAYPNDAGDFAFLVWLAGPGVTQNDASALYGPDASGALVLLARQGDPAPGTEPGTVFQALHDNPAGIVIDAAGQTVFLAALAGPAVTAANEFGIWLFDPTTSTVALRVREGDPAPELPGLVLAGLSLPILNNVGDLVFLATLEGPGVTPANDHAIFAIEADGTPREVVRTGDLLSLGPGDARPLASLSMLAGTYSSQPGATQLSDSGYLTFAASTSDGTSAVVVGTLPEPGVGAGLAAGLLLLAGLRRASRRR